MAVSKAQQDAVNKYKRANYDRLELLVLKGKKDAIKAYAAAHGESVNSFINSAVDNAMNGVSPAESPESVPAPLVVSEDVVKVKAHITRTGEDTSDFIHRAIADTIGRDEVLLKMGISPKQDKK